MALTDGEKAFALFVVVGAGALLLGSSSEAQAATREPSTPLPPVPTNPSRGEVIPLAPGTGVWTPASATGAASGSSGGYVAGADRGRPEVQRLQEMLADLGYDPGVIDGRFGPDTQRAVDDFGRSVGTRFARGYSQTTANAVGQMWSQGGVGVPLQPQAKPLSSGLPGGWRRY